MAPKLLSAVVKGASVELTFDEAVDWSQNAPAITINQTAVTTAIDGTLNSAVAGKYVYTVTNAASAALANGKHTIDITNATDFAGNRDALITKELEVKIDTVGASVTSIKPLDSTTFLVEFNKEVPVPSGTSFEIKKGSYVFDQVADFTVTPALANADGTITGVGTNSKYVKVTLTQAVANTQNPLYTSTENSVNLAVKVSNHKDAAGVIGPEYSGTVTLAKDLNAPTIVSDKLIDATTTKISIPFNKAVTLGTTPQVLVKDGNTAVTLTATAVAADGKTLELTGTFVAGKTYTISLGKGTVVAGTIPNETTELSAKVAETNAGYYNTAPTLTVTKQPTNKGFIRIEVAFGAKVNDAAALVASYKWNNVNLPEGTNVYFKDSTKTNVYIDFPSTYLVDVNNKAAKLTFNASTIKFDSAAAVGFANKVLSGSATAAAALEVATTLTDNVAPKLSKAEYVKDAAGLVTGFKLTFDENVADGTLVDTFVIKQGTTAITATLKAAAGTDVANDKVINLELAAGTTISATNTTITTNSDATKVTLTDATTDNVIDAFTAPISFQ